MVIFIIYVIVINGDKLSVYGDLMAFTGVSWWFNGDWMGPNDDLVVTKNGDFS